MDDGWVSFDVAHPDGHEIVQQYLGLAVMEHDNPPAWAFPTERWCGKKDSAATHWRYVESPNADLTCANEVSINVERLVRRGKDFIMQKRTFKITKAESGSWSTSFSIKDMDHENPSNSMAPEAFFHHLGALCGKHLDHIQGLTFEVILPSAKKSSKDDPLSLCGQTIGGKSA